MIDEIKAKLDDLYVLQCRFDLLALSKQDMIDGVLTLEIKNAIADIDAEFDAPMQAAGEAINAAKNEIKPLVIANGATVKGDNLQAVYSKPRVTWDSNALEGFAAAHPEIEKFRKVGNPSVSFR